MYESQLSLLLAVLQDHESVPGVDSATVEAADVMSVEDNDAINPHIYCVVLDCSSMMFIDYVGTVTIQQVALVLVELSTSLGRK